VSTLEAKALSDPNTVQAKQGIYRNPG